MTDSDFSDQSLFIARAIEIFKENGDRQSFAHRHPFVTADDSSIVRGYRKKARDGHYTTPEDVEAALVEMEWDILKDYFPEEYDRREAADIAEGDRRGQARYQKALAENPGDYDSEGNMLEDVVANRLRMADNDTKDTNFESPKPFIVLATKVLRDRGEKALFAGMNPVVRRYISQAREGYYRTPEELQGALVELEDELVYEYFPEEYAQREVIRAAETVPANQAREVEAAQKALNTDATEMPEEYRKGGRIRLI